MATKKITNFNAMRPAIIAAHNGGNRKAINKDMVDGAGIDNKYFITWQADVKKLQETVWDYVQKKKNARWDESITKDDLFAARDRIFPKWKEILSVCEENVDTKELKVSEYDVEDLIGFCWYFMPNEEKGTLEAKTSEQVFRKYVESLLGCAIARNAILDDTQRDTLDKYYHAQTKITKCNDVKSELESKKKDYEYKLKHAGDNKVIVDWLENLITDIDNDLKTNAEKKATAEAIVKEVSGEAKKILAKLKTI